MCTSGDIFQDKVDELLSDIKNVNIYLDGILVLGKESFSKKIEELRIIFSRLRAAGLN